MSGSISSQFVSVDNTAALTGFTTSDLEVTTTSDWTGAVLLLTLTQGTIYQEPEGFGLNGSTLGPPNPAGFGAFPSSEFDTSIGGDVNSPSIAGAAGDVGGDTPQFDTSELDISWYNNVTNDIGTFDIARITLSDDAVGTWSMKLTAAGSTTTTESGSITAGAFLPATPPAPSPPPVLAADFVSVDNSSALTGFNTHDLQVTTATDWKKTSLLIEIYQGSIYQDPNSTAFDGVSESHSSLFGSFPALEFDTYLRANATVVQFGGAAIAAGGDSPLFTTHEIDYAWTNHVSSDIGTFNIGRFTLSDDAVGRWSLHVNNAGGEIVSKSGGVFAGDFTNLAPPLPPQQVDDDFNSDGKTDILWRNNTTGQTSFWQMDGTTFQASTNLPDAITDTDWRAVGVGDFSADGNPDIFWRNTVDGRNKITSAFSGAGNWQSNILTLTNLKWQVAGTGDFTGDGKTDVLWRNSKNGRNFVWQMNGAGVQQKIGLKRLRNTDWQAAGVDDFNNDGKADILWRNSSNGRNTVWHMNGTAFQSSTAIRRVRNTDWNIAAINDYNNDGKADILWRNTTTGANTVWQMNGTAFQNATAIQSQTDQDWQPAGPLLGLWEA